MKKILLVSNQESFLGRNKTLLNRAGFVILTTTSTREALQIYREQPVDLIISMLDMPEMGGDQLCNSIRNGAGDRNVPFVLVCYDTDDAIRRATQCGANGWLIKPVHPERLLEQVGKFLRIPTRRDYRASFTAQVAGTRETVTFTGMTHNISASGILCETDAFLDQDDVITNLFVALEPDPILADGRVVRAEARTDGLYNYGVQFTSIPQESRDKIQKLVANPTPPPVRQQEIAAVAADPAATSPKIPLAAAG